MTTVVETLEALEVVLAEVEDALTYPDHPISYVGLRAAHEALTTDCDEPRINRLEHAPYAVDIEVDENDEFQPTGHAELIGSGWDETDSYWCQSCDTELVGALVAKAHLRGIDLTNQ